MKFAQKSRFENGKFIITQYGETLELNIQFAHDISRELVKAGLPTLFVWANYLEITQLRRLLYAGILLAILADDHTDVAEVQKILKKNSEALTGKLDLAIAIELIAINNLNRKSKEFSEIKTAAEKDGLKRLKTF